MPKSTNNNNNNHAAAADHNTQKIRVNAVDANRHPIFIFFHRSFVPLLKFFCVYHSGIVVILLLPTVCKMRGVRGKRQRQQMHKYSQAYTQIERHTLTSTHSSSYSHLHSQTASNEERKKERKRSKELRRRSYILHMHSKRYVRCEMGYQHLDT